MKKFFIYTTFLLSGLTFAEINIQGGIYAGQGGEGLIKGSSGDIIFQGTNITKCLLKRGYDTKNTKINIKHNSIYIEGKNFKKKIPVQSCEKSA
jgi:hypothetical protein